jgi:menaquinone-9 beta-reductase
MVDPLYDVVIVGGSFAGLSVAQELRGRRALIIDQRPIGANQTSSCGMPRATMRLVGADCAALETHNSLVLHTGGRTLDYRLPEPFVTFDYEAFCQAMLARTDAEVWLATASGVQGTLVQTSRGPVRGRFVVDASGWRSLSRRPTKVLRAERFIGYGTETELPLRVTDHAGLHFYFEKQIVRRGYAWVFPCGARTRIGLCTFEPGLRLRPLLDTFLARWGLRRGITRGGVMPVRRRAAVEDEVFVVGDAAGQCLPVTAEGIRTAIHHGRNAGRAIADALVGTISSDTAHARYAAQVRRTGRFHATLLRMQSVLARAPDGVLAAAGRAYTLPAISHFVVGRYLHASGWPS